MTEPWLGHRDLCSSQWSEWCDCDPDNPIDLSVPDETEEVRDEEQLDQP